MNELLKEQKKQALICQIRELQRELAKLKVMQSKLFHPYHPENIIALNSINIRMYSLRRNISQLKYKIISKEYEYERNL